MIALCADVHVGNHRTLGGQSLARLNDRCRETLRVFSRACEVAALEGATALVVLGDLFDTDDPSPPMVRGVLDALSKGPPRVLLLVGNHDQHSDQRRDHAMASLEGTWNSRLVSVIERPKLAFCNDISLAMVPFRPGKAEDWFPEAVRQSGPWGGDTRPLLCTHLGISDGHTEPWMASSHDQVHIETIAHLVGKHRMSGAAAGNWHHHSTWSCDNEEPVWQLGALCPTGWNNQGGDDLYGTLAFWDGQSFTRTVIQGPRYLKFSSVEEWRPHAGNEDVRARIVVPAGKLDMARRQIDVENPMGYVEVLADEKTTRRQVAAAAHAAREIADSDRALAAYVEIVTKGTIIDPADVLERVRGYLR